MPHRNYLSILKFLLYREILYNKQWGNFPAYYFYSWTVIEIKKKIKKINTAEP